MVHHGCVPVHIWKIALLNSDCVRTRACVGTSSGLGRALVYAALKRGDCVIATARSLETIEDFPKTDKIRLMQLDVTEGFARIQAKLNRAISFFGRVDVVVNNAGAGVPSILEEGG